MFLLNNMYYISVKMKNNIFKFIICLYYLSSVLLLIIYLFPGSIIGYLLYGDLGRQPNLINNPIGLSINHFFYFFYLTFLGLIYNLRERKFINSFLFLFILSFFLELLHFFIPNRAFELNDLLANNAGVVSVLFLFKLKKKFI
jgi:VanZ family protein|tara:strand:- start:429 stop:857 length:429 start_codon:yes stop_codon:yes gene_type:complete